MAATLPAAIQRELTAYYGVEGGPDVDDFIEASDDDAARESLLVREDEGGLAITLRLPRRGLELHRGLDLDLAGQLVEGVSHFICLAERARRELPVTHLELELQAEVDKYLLFAHLGPFTRAFDPARAADVRERLYARATFVDPVGSEPGDRYRFVNDLAARFVAYLERVFARLGRFDAMRSVLQRFHAAGQTEKIQLAQAA